MKNVLLAFVTCCLVSLGAQEILGHGTATYRLDMNWSKGDPAIAPVINSHAMAEGRDGHIYVVTDHPTNAFVVFRKDGSFVRSFGSGLYGGHGIEIFEHEGTEYLVHVDCGWHFEAEGWKAKPGNGRVTLLKTDGTVVKSLPTPMELGLIPDGDRKFMPCDVAFTPQATLLIADGYASDKIYELTLEGKHVKTWGGRSNDAGNLSNAHGISIDVSDPAKPLVWVASRNENKIKAFSLGGEYVETISLPGAYAGGLCFRDNRMYTAVCWSKDKDSGKRMGQSGFIVVLDRKTRKVISVPGGSEPIYTDGVLQPLYQTSKAFIHGHDLYVDSDGAIYMGEWNAKRRYPSKLTPVAPQTSNAIQRGHLQFSKQAMQKGKATVAFLGGSITEMDGYRPMVMADLQRRYPECDFTFTGAGLSSTCSTSGAFRFRDHVLNKGVPDLFFLEFAVNDDQDAGHEREQCIRGMEGIIRQAREANPNMDIIVTYFVNESHLKDYQAGRVPLSIAAHEEVLQHYNISASFLARQVASDISAGTYDWKKFGGVHPAPFGNRIAAGLVSNLLDAAAIDVPAPSYEFPAPLDPGSYFMARWLQPDAGKGGVVKTPDWAALPGGKRKHYSDSSMMCLEKAGQTCELDFEGMHVGGFILAGPDAGIVEVLVDGKSFGEIDLHHHYSKGLHYPRSVMFATDLKPGPHRLTLRMTDKGKGQALRLWRWSTN